MFWAHITNLSPIKDFPLQMYVKLVPFGAELIFDPSLNTLAV